MSELNIVEKGVEGEKNFKDWLNDHGFSFVHINQSKETISSLFSKKVKRPDFLVLIECIGLIAVDVKNKNMSGGVFTLDHRPEVKDVLAFERIFRLPVWYVYQGKNKNAWYWISALKVLEVADIRGENENSFLSIKKEEFIKVKTADDFSKIYGQKLTHKIKAELSDTLFNS